jgi:hypothetical protein
MKPIYIKNLKKPTLEEITEEELFKCRHSFSYYYQKYFIFNLPDLGTEKFYPFPHAVQMGRELIHSKWASLESARDHLKSTTLYAIICWFYLWRFNKTTETHYIGFKPEGAKFHVNRIKKIMLNDLIIKKLGINDLATRTRNSILFNHPKHGGEFCVKPFGIFTADRGPHPFMMILDDIYKDPQNPTKPTIIGKVTNQLFGNLIYRNPEFLFHVGTRQTKNDGFEKAKTWNDPNLPNSFVCFEKPAFDKHKKVLWKQRFNLEQLLALRRKDKKFFDREMLCKAALMIDTFITEEEIEDYFVLDNLDILQLAKLRKQNPKADFFGAWDCGGHTHPGYITLFMHDETEKKIYQVFEKWFDVADILAQKLLANELIEITDALFIRVDNTRKEIDAYICDNTLNPRIEPESQSLTSNLKAANVLRTFVVDPDYPDVYFINNRRTLDNILCVTKKGELLETKTDNEIGHGEVFRTTSYALDGFLDRVGVKKYENPDISKMFPFLKERFIQRM